MPLINTSVPNLIQGVSQQADATRFSGQCTEQENAFSSVAEGLKKRPNTRHIAQLLSTAMSNQSFIHFVNRSESERYVLIHDGTTVKGWNIITGNPATINGSTSYTPPSGSYLDTETPREILKGLTVGDNTFVLNTKQTVYLNQNKTPPLDKEALLFIKQGDYGKEYKVIVDVLQTNVDAYVPATAVVTFSRYTQEKWDNGGSNRPDRGSSNAKLYYTRYAYRVTGVTLGTNDDGVTGGSGYLAEPSVSLAGVTTASSPTFRANMGPNIASGTNITSITVLNPNANSVAGTGSRKVGARTYYGETVPNANLTITLEAQDISDSTVTLTAGVKSGVASDSNTQYPTSASTNAIANLLANGGEVDGTSGSDVTARLKGTGSERVGSRFDVHQQGNLIVLTRKLNEDGTGPAWTGDFAIRTEDGLGNNGIQSIYKEISSISDLPLFAKNGFKVKVAGDAGLEQDDYYVEFATNNGGLYGEGSWNECAGYDVEKGFDSSSMPLSIINNDEDSFKIQELDFTDRNSGDEFSNPNPSFVGKSISNMFFYKNRLGFLSEDKIILGESGLGIVDEESELLEYNFFRKTVTTLLDDDPIDVSVASTRVVDLTYAIGFQENLVLFSDDGQFVLKGGELLTPRSVSITPVTNFEYEDSVPPLPLGSYIYYPFNRGRFTGVREFTVNSTTDNYDSVEITEHVPSYIPDNIIQMKGTTAEDMIVMLSSNENNTLYVYNYFWNNNKKILSSWSKFTIDGEIIGIDFVGSTLYAVIIHNASTHLVELPLESGLKDHVGFLTHLDMRCYKTVAQGDDTITLPYTPADNTIEAYDNTGEKLPCTNSGATVTLTSPMATSPNISVTAMESGVQYTIVTVGNTDFTALGSENNDLGTSFYADGAGTGTGIVSAANVWVGIPYTMKYTFSEQLFKAKSGSGTSPSNAAKLLIRNGSLYYDKSAHFKVKVTPKLRGTSTSSFTARAAGSENVGDIKIDSGFFRFTVLTQPEDTIISIENDSALPSNFQSAEFESFVHSRSSRYG